MDTRKEISGSFPLKNGQVYVSPEVEIVDIQAQDIIAASTDYVNVDNPWNVDEQDW